MLKVMLLALSMFAVSIAGYAQNASVTLAWDYNYTQNRACTATIATNCVTGFGIWQTSFVPATGTPNTTRTKLISVVNGSNITGTVVIQHTLLLPTTPGTYTLIAATTYKDSAGALKDSADSNSVSAPITATITVPGNFRVITIVVPGT